MRTNPKHKLDILCPILKIVWEPFVKISSRGWHWLEFDQTKIERSLSVKGYPDAKRRDTAWQNFIQTHFQWQHVVILEPETDDTDKEYQIGFYEPKSGVCQKCSLVLRGLTGVLVGPDDASYFAVSLKSGKFLKLNIVDTTTKRKFKGRLI
jgi:hypothetical protein